MREDKENKPIKKYIKRSQTVYVALICGRHDMREIIISQFKKISQWCFFCLQERTSQENKIVQRNF